MQRKDQADAGERLFQRVMAALASDPGAPDGVPVIPEDVAWAAARHPGGIIAWEGLVLISYGEPVTHRLLTPNQARDLAATLIVKARAAALQERRESPADNRSEELGEVD